MAPWSAGMGGMGVIERDANGAFVHERRRVMPALARNVVARECLRALSCFGRRRCELSLPDELSHPVCHPEPKARGLLSCFCDAPLPSSRRMPGSSSLLLLRVAKSIRLHLFD